MGSKRLSSRRPKVEARLQVGEVRHELLERAAAMPAVGAAGASQALAAGLSRAIRSQLFGVREMEPCFAPSDALSELQRDRER